MSLLVEVEDLVTTLKDTTLTASGTHPHGTLVTIIIIKSSAIARSSCAMVLVIISILSFAVGFFR